MTRFAGVVFDVDGVLLDSLEAHLRVCRDKSAEFGLGLCIPDARELKRMVRAGTTISPMKHFFLAVGFPPELAERAECDYQREFVARYPIAPFEGVSELLTELAGAGLRLGIVTSNTLKNVRRALGTSFGCFDEGLLFAEDDERPLPKPEALRECTRRIGLTNPSLLLYVGDQPKDLQAAREAAVSFLGVTYGWGFDADDGGFAKVDSPAAITKHVKREAA